MSHLGIWDWIKDYLHELGLNPCCNGCRTWAHLIDGGGTPLRMICLNPCCNGCRTWAGELGDRKRMRKCVLILVVMDVALGQEV